MDIFQPVKDMLADPANRAVILYFLAALFLLIAMFFAFAGHKKKIIAKNRGVAIGGNNSGVVNAGDVGGNFDATVSTPRHRSTAKEPSSLGLLNLMAGLSAIVSAVFAILAYFLPPAGP